MKKTNLKREHIAAELRKRIRTGLYPVGTLLPGELSLRTEFGVARETLRKAVSLLEQEGMIHRQHGKGTYVKSAGVKDSCRPGILILAKLNNGTYATYHTLVPALERHFKAAGYAVDICDSQTFSKLTISNAATMLTDYNISAILLISSNFFGTETILEQLKKFSVPVILPMVSHKDHLTAGFAAGVWSVEEAWSMALKHLRELGHRRIGFITPSSTGSIREIPMERYREILDTLDIDNDPELYLSDPRISTNNDNLESCIKKEIRRMLELPSPPTAFICHADQWAPMVYQAVQDMGLSIPDDIAVMGFVSGFNRRYIKPLLSTVHIDLDKVAEITLDLVQNAEHWQKAPMPPNRELPLELIVCESTKKQ